MYSVYVTAVRLITNTSRPLEGKKSEILTERTFAGGKLKQLFLCILLKLNLTDFRIVMYSNT